MLLAIPSKGRAGLTTSQKILPNATWFVPDSELHQYKGLYKNVVGVPISVKGITATRNWILKNTDEKWVVFLDDDVKDCGYLKLLERKTIHIKIKDEKFWNDEFVKLFDLTEQLSYKIWGVKTESAPRAMYPYKPFLFKSYVTASCMGIINDGEYYFDERYKVKEDYEICLRHIRDKGGILAARYLHWENDHWEQDGGCKDYRTVEMEKNCIKMLIKDFPGMVKNVSRKANKFTIQLTL
jgi:glycosyltransferase involved in cell wall biosynthesis